MQVTPFSHPHPEAEVLLTCFARLYRHPGPQGARRAAASWNLWRTHLHSLLPLGNIPVTKVSCIPGVGRRRSQHELTKAEES
ncbi:hypothetical protein E2C01_032697 [Portunus trituberculatus]|uniref:Uncharacterized protein n=1 Tax=Portunus trituberculatus TaxID=210409 RepID=A0A5B7EY49_PORTR|nr:hypothetical protein [Portunus trituberculatus]